MKLVLHTFYAIDSKRDSKTGAMQVNVILTLSITQTGSLPSCLKDCVGAIVMLNKLINGSIVTVMNIQSGSKDGPAS